MIHENPNLLTFFQEVTPIEEISKLQISSRPARRKKGAKDFLKSDPPDYSTLHDHHIFPKSKAKKYGTKNGAVNMVFNRTLLFERTNQMIGNKDPKDYLAEIMQEQKIDEKSMRDRLATHFISKEAFDCMKNNDFHGFIAARSKQLLTKTKKLWH